MKSALGQRPAGAAAAQRRATAPAAARGEIPPERAQLPLWHAQHHVGRFPTELWGVQATQPPRAQLLVVPGNPGLAAFYRVLLQQLHAAFGGAADVMAVSHVGHDAHDISGGRVWGLDDQVEHKAALLRELVLRPGRPPAVILAHSIGAHIVLQALQRLEQQQQGMGQHTAGVLKVFLLMPFLACDWSSWEQQALAAAARRHAGVLTAAAGHISARPWLQRGVAQLLVPGAEPHAAASLRAGLRPAAFRNNWAMAAEEFRRLDAPVDWGPLRRLGEKAAVVYNKADPWFPQHDSMRAAVPNIEAYACSGLGHAFCLSTAECGVVADIVRSSVAPALGPGSSGAAGKGQAAAGRWRRAPRMEAAASGQLL